MDIALLWNIWNGAELLPVILFSKHVTVDVDDNGSFSCYMQSMFGQKMDTNSLSDAPECKGIQKWKEINLKSFLKPFF